MDTVADHAAPRAPRLVDTLPALLEVNNIEVVDNDVILVLRGLSLKVPEGHIVALLGANGAGKSTTLKAISGLLKTEEGEITRGDVIFAGERINGIEPDRIVRKGIFQVMEGRRIVADMTCVENLRLGAFTRTDRDVRADIERVFTYFPRLRERTGLAGYLSGGEQQMLAIGTRSHGSAEADPDGRAFHGALASAREGGVRHHPPPQPRARHHHPARRAERTHGAWLPPTAM